MLVLRRSSVVLALFVASFAPVHATSARSDPARERATFAGERLERSAYGPARVEPIARIALDEVAEAAQLDFAPRPRPNALALGALPDGASSSALLSSGATAPTIGTQYAGQFLFDSGITSIPPDCSLAAGPSHIVTVVNRHLSVWDKSTGTRLVSTLFTAFFGAVLGDPRVVYDRFSQRFFITAGDFNTQVFLAASVTDDPTGSWFKTSFVVSQGSDAARFPDFPTLSVDGNGLYVAILMGGGAPDTYSVFVLEKAPLIAPAPSLGVISAFRQLSLFDGTIQPCQPDVASAPMHLISISSAGALRLRRVNPPITAPTLTNVGTLPTAPFSPTSTAPAMGSTTNLDLGDMRLSTSQMRAGRIWTTHHVLEASGVSSARWYEVDVASLSIVQAGIVTTPGRFHFYPSIAVNAAGDAVLAFSGSNASEFVSAYVCGRLASDPPSMMSAPVVLKAGEAAYNRLDGLGRNRWGDYTTTVPDPSDPRGFWTFQEYARAGNTWGTRIAQLTVSTAGEAFCTGDGLDAASTTACPCANTGAQGHGCASSVNGNGALLSTAGSVANDDVVLVGAHMPFASAAIYLKGDAEELGGAVFGDGLRCAGGVLMRLHSVVNSGGASQFPGPGDPTLSLRGNTPVGSGLIGLYQIYYRNAAAAFCPPATFNASNGVRVVW